MKKFSAAKVLFLLGVKGLLLDLALFAERGVLYCLRATSPQEYLRGSWMQFNTIALNALLEITLIIFCLST